MQLYMMKQLKKTGLYCPLYHFYVCPEILSYKIIVLTTLERCSRDITICLRVDPKTLNTCRSLSSPFYLTTLRMCRSSSEVLRILIILLTHVHKCRCTRLENGAGPFYLRSNEDWLTLLFCCSKSFPFVLALLFLNSSLSLTFPPQHVAH